MGADYCIATQQTHIIGKPFFKVIRHLERCLIATRKLDNRYTTWLIIVCRIRVQVEPISIGWIPKDGRFRVLFGIG